MQSLPNIQIILPDFTCYNLMHIKMNKPKGNTHYHKFLCVFLFYDEINVFP